MDQEKILNDINEKKSYIFDNSNELSIENRKELLQIIYNSKFRNTIIEKGGGVQIKLDELIQPIIDKLYVYIVDKLNEQNTEFI